MFVIACLLMIVCPFYHCDCLFFDYFVSSMIVIYCLSFISNIKFITDIQNHNVMAVVARGPDLIKPHLTSFHGSAHKTDCSL